jgi:hypothetical protein
MLFHVSYPYGLPINGQEFSRHHAAPEFVTEISEKHVGARKADRSVPAVRALSRLVSVDDIARTVKEIVQGGKSLARKVTIYICHRYGGGSLKAIGAHFGIGDSGCRRRLRANPPKSPFSKGGLPAALMQIAEIALSRDSIVRGNS